MRWHRRQVSEPITKLTREPHPNPAVEAELARIDSLRSTISRKETLLATDHKQIAQLRDTITRHPTWDGTFDRKEQIKTLLHEAADLETEITKIYDEIAGHIATLDVNDAAWLGIQ